ncbi:PLP-dependent aminotransferase family protein [Chryseolinea lacunae]|uniref:PLP-dependent aminotransferase family protein n=1 Tax=Chryseolinea lacunae TaxID=2801331 RepID=A0ABS1KLJ4_9BACT|nr:PLP-dependent aminotransferase family protein [Chryseolinea lacunae]MBL0740343.1 PLP-dependent aminotransferase family protein [Chryseolinea lacunae]
MNVFRELITIDKHQDVPVYLQISNAIIHNIRRGTLRRGMKLPGSRELAGLLSIHRKTMLAAYDELMAQGWIEMIPRKGTFVVRDLPDIKPKKIKAGEDVGQYPTKTLFAIDEKSIVHFPQGNFPDPNILCINDGFPDIRLAPTELFLREFRSLARLRAYKKYYQYGSAKGPTYLRETLAPYLSDTRGLPITPANVLVTKGAQMGIYLTARLLIKPGDNVVVGEPSYFAATRTFQHVGAQILRVPVDENGMDVEALERLCKKKRIRLIYVIPHHHHPTTVTLPPDRRIRLLELAAHYKFAIIEDDYDYDFHYASNPILPMASLDHHGNVIYIGTLSKTLAPSIRVGFMVAPENFINAAAHLRRAMDWQGDSMMEVAIAELYRNGVMGRHIKKVVKIYHERRDHFCQLMKDSLGEKVTFKIPDGGMSIWTTFNSGKLTQIAEKAAKKGLVFADGTLYNTHKTDYNASRMGFASLQLKEQEKAIAILSEVLS